MSLCSASFVLVGAVNLEHTVSAVTGVACDQIVIGLALVENKIVQERLFCAWRCFSEAAFFVFVVAKVGVDDGVDEPENGKPLRW